MPSSLLLLALLACDPARAPSSSSTDVVAPAVSERADIPAWADGPKGPRVSVVGDLRDPSTGRMHMTMRFDDLDESMWSFRVLGVDPELKYENVRFTTLEGRSVGHDRDGRTLELSGKAQPGVIVEYDVIPGGDGRHGHQGIVQDEFALVDGRIFMVPDGAGGLRGARARFLAPDGWTTVSALREADGWLYYDQYGPERVLTSLSGACIGVGPFVV